MEQKVFLITGASRGIGHYLAERYLEAGHIVAGCSRTDVVSNHSSYRHFCLDVADATSVSQMVWSVKKEFRRIDVLLNNAGIASMNHCLTTPSETVQRIFSVNFLGSFNCLREVAKVMVRNKSGRIVNFSTIASPLNLEGEAVYASSKAAIESLTRISAKELGGFGITVNAVGPTPVDTSLLRGVPRDKISSLVNQQAIKRMGTCEDVKNVIDFYIQHESSFITGQVLYLGGIS